MICMQKKEAYKLTKSMFKRLTIIFCVNMHTKVWFDFLTTNETSEILLKSKNLDLLKFSEHCSNHVHYSLAKE